MFSYFGIIILKYAIGFLIVWLIFSYATNPKRTFSLILSHTYHPFSDLRFSTKEFYDKLKENIQHKEIGDVYIDQVTYSQKALIPTYRLYLQVWREDRILLICAAPFGTDFFVSLWAGEPYNLIKDFFNRLPLIGKPLLLLFYSKTFYQKDTEAMFESTIRNCVMATIDYMTTNQGVRSLTEMERLSMTTQSKHYLKN